MCKCASFEAKPTPDVSRSDFDDRNFRFIQIRNPLSLEGLLVKRTLMLLV